MATLVLDKKKEIANNIPLSWAPARIGTGRYATGSCRRETYAVQYDFFHSTASIRIAEQSLANNGIVCRYLDYGYVENRTFDKIESVLEKEYNYLKEYFEDIPFNEITRALRNLLPSLEYLLPSALKVELTSEQSLFYTFKKGEFTVYLQHFVEGALENDEYEVEATLTVFDKNTKMPSFAGSTEYILSQLLKMFPINSANLFNFKWNELPL